ncbi:response regulator transcription factor [Novipirellula sp.]|uniref:response regulator transcription factor n=1 Tax=Novipirellula sp. TaxID=2795430 RepID=UPI00356AE82A
MDEPLRISIVDDDASVRRALDRLCRSAGYIVLAYESAEAFLEFAVDPIDCLILDVHLPGLSGLQLQQHLHDLGKHIPIVFVTAFEDDSTRRQAIAMGALAFLQKPLDNEQLLDVIETTCRHSG